MTGRLGPDVAAAIAPAEEQRTVVSMNDYSPTAVQKMNAAIRDFVLKNVPHPNAKTKILYGRDAARLPVGFFEPGYQTDGRAVDPTTGCECGCGDLCPPDAVRVWWFGGKVQREFRLRDFGTAESTGTCQRAPRGQQAP